MFRRLNAYLTVEASYIFSIIIALYYLIIVLAFYLFAGCINSQNLFFESLHTARFTYSSTMYNEVIYGDMDSGAGSDFGNVRSINPIAELRATG